MTVRQSHLGGCIGFWLWGFVGAGCAFALVSFIGFVTAIPALGVAFLLQRRPQWRDGSVVLGIVSGAGAPLLLVAALHWNDWHHRIAGDNTPNPYDWGGVGLALVLAGMVAYAVDRKA